MELQPLFDKVLVEPELQEKVGEFWVSNSENQIIRGKVLGVGKGKVLENGTLRPPSLEPGMIVVFNKHIGNEVKSGQNSYYILGEEDVLGIDRSK